jgi:hypothetical protein
VQQMVEYLEDLKFEEEDIEIDNLILKTIGKVAVCHGDFVKVRQHGKIVS